VDQSAQYIALLVKWQRSQRLVGSSDPDWIVDHILLDSLLFTRVIPAASRSILDVGSGAGVPGVPLGIVLPESTVTLLEARAKRVSFLSAVVRELDLTDCEVVHGRLETLAAERGRRYDTVVMRCAGDPSEFYPAAATLLTPGGVIAASGPPRRRPISRGEWREVDGPLGRRLFWVAQ
jgi:16S rRNA (guanine527-N7)-methyltransferase